MEMDIEMGTDLELEDEDPDRRPTTLLGRIRRLFDRRPSSRRCNKWFDTHPAGAHWTAWGCGAGGGGCDSGGSGGACSGGCGGGGCGSC